MVLDEGIYHGVKRKPSKKERRRKQHVGEVGSSYIEPSNFSVELPQIEIRFDGGKRSLKMNFISKTTTTTTKKRRSSATSSLSDKL